MYEQICGRCEDEDCEIQTLDDWLIDYPVDGVTEAIMRETDFLSPYLCYDCFCEMRELAAKYAADGFYDEDDESLMHKLVGYAADDEDDIDADDEDDDYEDSED